MQETKNQRWELDTIFPGGSGSLQLLEFLIYLEEDVKELHQQMGELQPPQVEAATGGQLALALLLQNTASRLEEVEEFAACLVAQNVQDEQAMHIHEKVLQLHNLHQACFDTFDAKASQVPETVWQALLHEEAMQGIGFYLNERRKQAQLKLPPTLESFGNELAVDGLHAWQALYAKIIGRIRVTHEIEGQTLRLTVPQFGKFLFSKDRDVRKQAFAKAEDVLAKESDLCAHALNSLAGYRLTLYKQRGWDSVLKHPLQLEAMSEQTLTTMWQTVEQNLPRLLPFLQRKAQLMGIEKVSYFDLLVPCTTSSKQMSYEEAIAFITEQFAKFDLNMADFAKRAVELRWLDVEEREGKLPNGFCTRHPESKQSRIQYTFHGSALHVSSLAHELGHAYNNFVMQDLPYFMQTRGRSVAETASTFAEQVVADAALQAAGSDEERVPLWEAKAQNMVLNLMITYSAYLFELAFYEERRQGPVSPERLTELMVDAQKRASFGALEQHSRYQWMLRNHLYKTDFPFYNFPYAFGYLFSAGVYAQALVEGPQFKQKYVALLRDTGAMTVEQLSQKHLGADLTQPQFWQKAIDLVMSDAESFVRATESWV